MVRQNNDNGDKISQLLEANAKLLRDKRECRKTNEEQWKRFELEMAVMNKQKTDLETKRIDGAKKLEDKDKTIRMWKLKFDMLQEESEQQNKDKVAKAIELATDSIDIISRRFDMGSLELANMVCVQTKRREASSSSCQETTSRDLSADTLRAGNEDAAPADADGRGARAEHAPIESAAVEIPPTLSATIGVATDVGEAAPAPAATAAPATAASVAIVHAADIGPGDAAPAPAAAAADGMQCEPTRMEDDV